MCEQTTTLFTMAYKKMREASYQSHGNHWDKQGTQGKNSPECIRAKKLRDEADELYNQALSISDMKM